MIEYFHNAREKDMSDLKENIEVRVIEMRGVQGSETRYGVKLSPEGVTPDHALRVIIEAGAMMTEVASRYEEMTRQKAQEKTIRLIQQAFNRHDWFEKK